MIAPVGNVRLRLIRLRLRLRLRSMVYGLVYSYVYDVRHEYHIIWYGITNKSYE